MTAATRMLLLGAALAPYITVAGIDAWMHERARRVPRIEQILHYAAGLLFVGFVVAVFRDASRLALVLFASFAVIAAWDEIGFHRHLDRRERRVHLVAYAALALFVGAWRLLGPGA